MIPTVRTLPLAISLAGLDAQPSTAEADGPRGLVRWAAELGYRGLQLDASMPGMRPRELDRSGRRDLAALFRRGQLAFGGVDLWIPPAHFADPARADRAVSAVVQAVELAAELGALLSVRGPSVSLTLPVAPIPGARDGLAAAGERWGTRIADHQWPLPSDPAGPIGVGIDPATIVLAGADPVSLLSTLRPPPFAARLSDIAASGRVEVGTGVGRLDVALYEAALVTAGFVGVLVVDLRGVRDPAAVAATTLARLGHPGGG